MDKYLKLFALTNNFTADDLKNSYRKLCSKYHPDKTSGKTTELFQEVQLGKAALEEFLKTRRPEPSHDEQAEKIRQAQAYAERMQRAQAYKGFQQQGDPVFRPKAEPINWEEKYNDLSRVHRQVCQSTSTTLMELERKLDEQHKKHARLQDDYGDLYCAHQKERKLIDKLTKQLSDIESEQEEIKMYKEAYGAAFKISLASICFGLGCLIFSYFLKG